MSDVDIFDNSMWIGVPSNEYAKRNFFRNGIETAYFRTSFNMPCEGSLILSVSASSRYKLWVNGKSAVFGPCKGDRWDRYFETIDVSKYLHTGENLIAVKVVSFPPYEYQRGYEKVPTWAMFDSAGPCLIVSGKSLDKAGNVLHDITTGSCKWKVCLDSAIEWEVFPQTRWIGPLEKVYADRIPHNWKTDIETDAAWSDAENLWPANDNRIAATGGIPIFPLKERPIPLLFECERQFVREMPTKSSDEERFTFSGFTHPALIPPGSKMIVVLDAGELTTGFMNLSFKGGRGSSVSIIYAESYLRQDNGITSKGKRDDWENYELIGHMDRYFPSGREETYEPFWFRTFRFVRIEAVTADESLTVYPPVYFETGYPLNVLSYVDSPAEWVGRLWDISARTLRRCMHETYEDCPYYEQLQYAQDTRLEILFTYMASGDTRLALRAVHDFHSSLLPEGILQSRYPCHKPQVIPPFSLHWIAMLTEYYWQTCDASIPKRYRPTVDTILDWYDRKIGKYGLVEKLGHWDQIDWVKQWSYLEGRTPASLVGPSTTHNLMYVCGLKAGAEINRITGRDGVAEEYEKRAEEILFNVEKYCWSDKEMMYMEGPGYEEYSQHAQVYAVLSGLASGDRARMIIDRALNKEDIALCSFTQQFFLFRAMEKCGLYHKTEKQWELWKELLSRNLTTVPEVPEGFYEPRSDCHAWSALPLYEFTRGILGVNPAAPGWSKILVRPRVLSLPGGKRTGYYTKRHC